MPHENYSDQYVKDQLKHLTGARNTSLLYFIIVKMLRGISYDIKQ